MIDQLHGGTEKYATALALLRYSVTAFCGAIRTEYVRAETDPAETVCFNANVTSGSTVVDRGVLAAKQVEPSNKAMITFDVPVGLTFPIMQSIIILEVALFGVNEVVKTSTPCPIDGVTPLIDIWLVVVKFGVALAV